MKCINLFLIFRKGTLEEFKKKEIKVFKRLKDSLNDLEQWEGNESMLVNHLCMKTLTEMIIQNIQITTESYVALFNKMHEDIIKDLDIAIDLSKLMKISKFYDIELPAFCTLLGGIAAQEVIKNCGIYLPLNQWYHYDISSAVPQNTLENSSIDIDENSRYYNQIKIFGKYMQERIQSSK